MKRLIFLVSVLSIRSLGLTAQDGIFEYDHVLPFNEGYAMVMKDGKCGYIDTTGTLRIPLQFDYAGIFRDGVAQVLECRGEGGFTIDESRIHEVSDSYWNVDDYTINWFGQDYSKAFIDKSGHFTDFHDTVSVNIFEIAPELKYETAGDSCRLIGPMGETVFECAGVPEVATYIFASETMTLQWGKDNLKVIDKSGTVTATLSGWEIWDSFDDKYVVKYTTGKKYILGKRYGNHGPLSIRSFNKYKYRLKDKENRNLSKGYKYISRYVEGLANACNGHRYGYLDSKGNVVIPFRYKSAGDFREGLAKVGNGKHYGFIDKDGNTVIPFIYDEAYCFHDGYTAVKKNGKWGFIDKSGKPIQ
ncbi:MAG: WG repeat-containing protein [Bacteroidetes bacterium]|nr:WG repeat-containing protein [Candidatus Colenecus caballi]